MKFRSLWDLIAKNDSDFNLIVCDTEHTLFHLKVDPTKTWYRLPMEAKSWDIQRVSIKESEVHIWVK